MKNPIRLRKADLPKSVILELEQGDQKEYVIEFGEKRQGLFLKKPK